ncbi:alpha/beta hydrolase [Algiphilus aromaticivorans]|uniref:alpha/beta hydrolase n=1 Tax=Algiphilus aromaticivorans TaxID=382454 RepID=UPI0005C16D0B
MLGLLLVAGAIGFVILGSLLYAFQERLIFLPGTPGCDLRATPADAGLAYEDVAITTTDGERLRGWFVPAEDDAAPVLLHFHGNAGNIGDRIDLLQLFHELGLATLIVDYRGYGQSTGRPSEEGTYRDAMAAWRHLVDERGIHPERILLHGQSLGGAVAAWLATEVAPAGLILDSTFTSVPAIAAEIYPWLPTRRLARIDYDTLSRVPQIDAPTLVLHSRDDDIIGFHHGQRLAEAANTELVALSGGHNEAIALSRQRYRSALHDFVATLDASPRTAPGQESSNHEAQ